MLDVELVCDEALGCNYVLAIAGFAASEGRYSVTMRCLWTSVEQGRCAGTATQIAATCTGTASPVAATCTGPVSSVNWADDAQGPGECASMLATGFSNDGTSDYGCGCGGPEISVT